jgi:hypothetical protein
MKPMDLNKPYSGWSLFVGGMYGSGKTTFLGDMLAYEQERGKVAYVMTPMEGDETKGGWRSIAGLGINEAYLVETYDDLKDLLKKFRTDRYQAVGVDQLCGVATLIRLKLLGENRMPNTTLKRNEYGEINAEFCSFVREWNNSVHYSMMVAPTDITAKDDQTGQQPSMQDMATSQKFIRPMMEWTKLEFLIPGLFDLCFHLDVSGYKEVMKRQLITRQGKQFGTKQRLPQSQRIDTNLEMTDDLQNWAKIIHHLEGGPAHG